MEIREMSMTDIENRSAELAEMLKAEDADVDTISKETEELEARKAEINKALGCEPEWNPNPNAKDKTITLSFQTDLSDPEKTEESLEWMVKNTIVFWSVFSKEIKAMK